MDGDELAGAVPFRYNKETNGIEEVTPQELETLGVDAYGRPLMVNDGPCVSECL